MRPKVDISTKFSKAFYLSCISHNKEDTSSNAVSM